MHKPAVTDNTAQAYVAPKSQQKQWIAGFAGNEKGLISSTLLCFKSNHKTDDHRKERKKERKKEGGRAYHQTSFS